MRPVITRAPVVATTILFFAFLAACSDQVGDTSDPVDQATAVSEIRRSGADFSATYVLGDVDSLMSYYTSDAVAAAGNNDFVVGRSALAAMWALPQGRSILCHASHPEEIEVNGDLAYDWGYYEGRAAQDGEPLEPFFGKYVIVWKRGSDGRWQMAIDVWSRVPEPPPSTGQCS